MQYLVSNLSGTSRFEELNGTRYLVVPMTLIAPGVLNGSKGELYYPPDEIANSVDAWNNTPIVINHPMNGQAALSARDPAVLGQQGVGYVFNARMHNGKLKAEGWFDIEATKRVDNRVLNNLEAGTQMELSTGLFTDNEPARAGSPFSHIARNYRPDHLAVLPDQKGACSLADGCGVLVNADTTEAEELPIPTMDEVLGIERKPISDSNDDVLVAPSLTEVLRSEQG